MTDFQTGLLISVVGLLVTFTALGIFIGIIVLLQKLFPVKAKEEKADIIEAEAPAVIASNETDAGIDEIAAILAAASFVRSQQSGQLGAELMAGPGPYRTTR